MTRADTLLDAVALAFLARPSRGRVFQYSNAGTYVAMRVLASVVGDVADWLGPRLFAPLGIDDVSWERCPLGHVRGATASRSRPARSRASAP